MATGERKKSNAPSLAFRSLDFFHICFLRFAIQYKPKKYLIKSPPCANALCVTCDNPKPPRCLRNLKNEKEHQNVTCDSSQHPAPLGACALGKGGLIFDEQKEIFQIKNGSIWEYTQSCCLRCRSENTKKMYPRVGGTSSRRRQHRDDASRNTTIDMAVLEYQSSRKLEQNKPILEKGGLHPPSLVQVFEVLLWAARKKTRDVFSQSDQNVSLVHLPT